MKKYNAILFDMDGVIVDSMGCHASSWIDVFSGYSIKLNHSDIYAREGMSGLESIIDIFKEKQFPVPSMNELRILQDRKLELFEKHSIHIFPEIPDILEFISVKKIPMGLVTGSLRRSVNHVLPADIESFFSVIVTVEDIRRGKPDPEPYLRAAGEIGCPPDKALVIENAPMGILSAKGASMDCFAIETTLKKPYLKNADMVFPDHRTLYEYLKTNLT